MTTFRQAQSVLSWEHLPHCFPLHLLRDLQAGYKGPGPLPRRSLPP